MSIIKRKGNIALDEGFSSRPCRILYGYHDVNDTDNDSGETFWYETEKYQSLQEADTRFSKLVSYFNDSIFEDNSIGNSGLLDGVRVLLAQLDFSKMSDHEEHQVDLIRLILDDIQAN